MKIKDKKYREDILNEMWKKVETGEYGEIHDIHTDSGTEIKWVNAHQIFIKCSHCGQITNKTKKTPVDASKS